MEIGAEYGGGKIAWIDASGEHGLIAAKADIQGGFSWGMAKIAHKPLVKGMSSGWHLPSKEELNMIYLNKDLIGGFADGGYWSSTESTEFNAWFQFFSNGSQLYDTKTGIWRVRPVRTF